MNIERLKQVHFIGIGGIGMSALARYFRYLGKNVSGYDRSSSQLTKELSSEGMTIYHSEEINNLPSIIRENPLSDEVMIVYTPAIPEEHAELVFFRKHKIRLYKRAEVLGFISSTMPCIAIGGTHGKTTTTSLLTFICKTAESNFISFVGGINENFNSNLVIRGRPEFMITEADEYDRSFLRLHPRHIILTSMDADHLDIYGTADEMKESYREFAFLKKKEGFLLVNRKITPMLEGMEFETYGIDAGADHCAANIEFANGRFRFDYKSKGMELKGLEISMPGYHNVENATAAIAMALKIGVDEASIRNALSAYKGVKRRFEFHINRSDLVFVDDYAHHPGEIDAVLSSMRKMYPGKRITCVFQPHLYSRTRDLGEGFSASLGAADELILLEIYPAREAAIPGITSRWLLDRVKLVNKSLSGKEDLVKNLKKLEPEIIVTLGAGDIDQLVPEIKTAFES